MTFERGRRGLWRTIGECKQRAVTRDRKSSDPGQVKEEERVNHDRRAKEREGQKRRDRVE